jgi:hypothetical protein
MAWLEWWQPVAVGSPNKSGDVGYFLPLLALLSSSVLLADLLLPIVSDMVATNEF